MTNFITEIDVTKHAMKLRNATNSERLNANWKMSFYENVAVFVVILLLGFLFPRVKR